MGSIATRLLRELAIAALMFAARELSKKLRRSR